MKRLLFIMLCICFSITASAQKIHFTDTTNVWSELRVLSTGGPTRFYYDVYTFNRDTTIGGIDYKWFSFETGFVSGGGTFIREDTVLRKVYIRQCHLDATPDTDVVLMDYSLNVGDTFAGSYYDTMFKFRYIVTGIDSTLINSVWHKVWHFSRDLGGSYSYWCDVVEGIGCIQHPTHMLQTIGVIGEGSSYMYCFSNQGTSPPVSPAVSFLDNTTSCTYYSTLPVNVLLPNNKLFKLYPSPAGRSLTISASCKIALVTISNLLGQTVLSFEYNSDKVELDVTDLPTGVYLVRINGTEVRKFIKE
jgi:hypothetical protein